MRCHRHQVVDADTEMLKLLDALTSYAGSCIEILSAHLYEK